MPSPLTVKRNDYHARPKRSDVYTPPRVARFLFDILGCALANTILDPAIGTGRLTDPWYEAGCGIIGVDTVNHQPRCHSFHLGRYEETERLDRPDLVLCNPLCCGQHKGFSVAQIIMWSSSFLQPYFSMMLVFCTT